MTTLVVGATGATGHRLVQQLLRRGEPVRAIVRSARKLENLVDGHDHLSVIEGNVLDASRDELSGHLAHCDAVASCLGHNLSLGGVYGQPRRLVADTTRRLCEAIRANDAGHATRYVLMNTVGNRNRDLDESRALGERALTAVLRVLLPPQADNEEAADYLRTRVGRRDDRIEWVAVRPDSLTEDENVSPYVLHAAPTQSALFGSGETSRVNVADFMARLVTEDDLWQQWKGQMPVIYNEGTD